MEVIQDQRARLSARAKGVCGGREVCSEEWHFADMEAPHITIICKANERLFFGRCSVRFSVAAASVCSELVCETWAISFFHSCISNAQRKLVLLMLC